MTFRKDIEGLRAIAVVAVVLYHARVPGFSGGYVGVDVFFVISGFLITTQLLKDDALAPLVRIRRFYARRVRRIVPAATLTIVGTLAIAAVLLPPLLQRAAQDDGVSAMFFFSNIRFSRAAVDYFRQADAPSLFQHFWSLSVEEQFYLLWPAVLVLASVAPIRRRRFANGVLIGGIFLVSLAASVYLTKHNPLSAFYLLPARAWELSLGAMLSVWGKTFVTSPRLAALVRVAGLALIVASIGLFGDVQYFPGYAALVPVSGTALVIAAGMAGGELSVGGWLALAPMQLLLGRYSYSLYLWHWPALMLTALQFPRVLTSWPRALVVMGVAALPAAVVSYHVVEHPFRLRFNPRVDRDSLAAGAAILGAGALFLVGFGVFAMGDLATSHPAPQWAGRSLTNTSFVPSNLEPTLLAADNTGGDESARSCASLRPCILGDVSSTDSIFLYGDSHAMHWLAAFDVAGKLQHWRVVAFVRPGCPAYVHPPTVKFLDCTQFRANANRLVRETQPKLVVLSSSSVRAYNALGPRIADGVRRAVLDLPLEIPVVVLGQTPTAGDDVPSCLSEHLRSTRQCEPRFDGGHAEEINRYLRSAIAGTQATFLEARALLCARECPVVVGNVLVYSDDDHVTFAFSHKRGPVLGALLARLLAG